MIKVNFRSALKNYVPGESEQVELEYEPGITTRVITDKYSIHPGHIGLVIVDGKLEDLDCNLADGSEVELYPIFGGG
ncbi:MAG: hypothetical protein ACQES4_11430 [Bacillota bacterium]